MAWACATSRAILAGRPTKGLISFQPSWGPALLVRNLRQSQLQPRSQLHQLRALLWVPSLAPWWADWVSALIALSLTLSLRRIAIVCSLLWLSCAFYTHTLAAARKPENSVGAKCCLDSDVAYLFLAFAARHARGGTDNTTATTLPPCLFGRPLCALPCCSRGWRAGIPCAAASQGLAAEGSNSQERCGGGTRIQHRRMRATR